MIFDSFLKPALDSVNTLISQFHLSPEDQVKARQAVSDATEKARLDSQQYEIQLATLAASDKISARNMQMTTKDGTPKLLSLFCTAGFFGLLGFMCLHEVPASSKDLINIMLGALGSAWVTIIGYWFGSSAGSAAKDATIAKSAVIK